MGLVSFGHWIDHFIFCTERNREGQHTDGRHGDVSGKVKLNVKLKNLAGFTVANSVFYVDAKSASPSKNINIVQDISGARASDRKKDKKLLYNGGLKPLTYSDTDLSKKDEDDDDEDQDGRLCR